MKYRAYFKIRFTAVSPVSIGSSASGQTDRDVALDSRGLPVIPATAIAGVLRSFAVPADRDKFFGEIINDDSGAAESKLEFYDAEYTGPENGVHISIRDSVRLSEHKTSVKGAKFDFQVVEPGSVFVGYIAAKHEEAADLLKGLLRNPLSFGAKTTRGYGAVKTEYRFVEYKLEDEGVLDEWLDFDIFKWPDDGGWVSCGTNVPEGKTAISISLEQNGSALSVRQYSVEPGKADYGTLLLKDGTPVVPGTSWAGAFRRRMAILLGDETGLDSVFGCVGPKDAIVSKISFSESRFEGFVPKQLTRNAIDRFTNGTQDGALYTEDTVYGGRASLEIVFDKNIEANIKNALCAAIMDLHYGYLSVGGLTAVGRGLFRIAGISVNGKEQLMAIDYESLVQEVCNV